MCKRFIVSRPVFLLFALGSSCGSSVMWVGGGGVGGANYGWWGFLKSKIVLGDMASVF